MKTPDLRELNNLILLYNNTIDFDVGWRERMRYDNRKSPGFQYVGSNEPPGRKSPISGPGYSSPCVFDFLPKSLAINAEDLGRPCFISINTCQDVADMFLLNIIEGAIITGRAHS